MARENHPFMLFVLLRRLKIVDRLDSADDLGSRLDVLDDLIHALVRHRRLIKGIGNDAGGVDTRHPFRMRFASAIRLGSSSCSVRSSRKTKYACS